MRHGCGTCKTLQFLSLFLRSVAKFLSVLSSAFALSSQSNGLPSTGQVSWIWQMALPELKPYPYFQTMTVTHWWKPPRPWFCPKIHVGTTMWSPYPQSPLLSSAGSVLSPVLSHGRNCWVAHRAFKWLGHRRIFGYCQFKVYMFVRLVLYKPLLGKSLWPKICRN